jgi:hypothetical protein
MCPVYTLLCLAEREGFEPPVRSRGQLISSQPRSTTPAPLLGPLINGLWVIHRTGQAEIGIPFRMQGRGLRRDINRVPALYPSLMSRLGAAPYTSRAYLIHPASNA